MVLKRVGAALEATELPERHPERGEVRVAVTACGVCRTDLHVVDGELPHPQCPSSRGTRSLDGSTRLGAGVEGLVPSVKKTANTASRASRRDGTGHLDSSYAAGLRAVSVSNARTARSTGPFSANRSPSRLRSPTSSVGRS